MTGHEPLTPLLELDSDLGRLLTHDRAHQASAELGVRLTQVSRGSWDAGRLGSAHPENVGLLMVEGIIAREVLIADTVSTELLGVGDLIRPWSEDGGDTRLLALEVRWTVLADARMAVLDRRFASRLARFPEVNATLLDRLTDRAQRMAVSQAISQLNGVDRRLLALFWHLAERWGRMTPAGVAVPMTLSHRILAQLVGARRPTVSTALAELAERGELVRRDDATWLLAGEPIGIPTAEAERVIQHRRRLLPPVASAPEPPERRVPVTQHYAGAGGQATRDELFATLWRVRHDVELEVSRLRESRRTASELCRRAGELRAHGLRRALP
jgi:hypothetical protein